MRRDPIGETLGEARLIGSKDEQGGIATHVGDYRVRNLAQMQRAHEINQLQNRQVLTPSAHSFRPPFLRHTRKPTTRHTTHVMTRREDENTHLQDSVDDQ